MHRQNMMGLHPMRDESISHVPANAIQNQNKQITVIKEFIDGYCNVSLDYDHTFIKKFEEVISIIDHLQYQGNLQNDPIIGEYIRFILKKLECTDVRHKFDNPVNKLYDICLKALARLQISDRLIANWQGIECALVFIILKNNEHMAVQAISIVKDILKSPKVKPTNYMHSLVCDFTLIYQNITNDLLTKQIKTDFENAHLRLSRKEIFFNDSDEQVLKELISNLYLEKDVAFDKDKVRYRNNDQRGGGGGNNKKVVMKLYPLAEKSIKVLAELPSLLLIYFTTESSQNREPSTSFINLCDSILSFCTVYLSKEIKDKFDDVTINAIFSAQIRCLCFLGRVAEQTFKNYTNKPDLGRRFLYSFRNLFDNSLFEVLPDRIDIIQNMKVFFASKTFVETMMKLLPELFYESHIVGCRYTERESLYNNGIRMQLDILTNIRHLFNYELFNMACCHVIKQIHDVRCFNTNSNGYITFIEKLVQTGLSIEEKEKKPVRKHFFELLECLVHKLGYIQDFIIPFAKTELTKLKHQGNGEYQPVNLQHSSNSYLKLDEEELKPTTDPENHAKIEEISIDCLHQKYFNYQIIDIRIFVRSIVDSSYTLMKALFETAQITESEGITNEHEIIEELFIRVLNCLEYIRLAKQYILAIQKIYTEQMQDEDTATVEKFVSIFTMNIGSGFIEYLLQRNFNSILSNMMHERNIGHLILKFIDHEKTFFIVTGHIVKYLHQNILNLATRSRDLVSLVILQGFEKLFRPSSKVYQSINPETRRAKYEEILSAHLLPIVKFAIENIFSVGDNNFYLSILKSVSRQTSDSILSDVVGPLLKDYFHTVYLVLLKLYNAEKLPAGREAVAETLSTFSCNYTNNAKCYNLWLIAMKAGWKQRNTSIISNPSHSPTVDFSAFKTSYLFNFDFQDGISFIEVMHDLMSPTLAPNDNIKHALFAIREVTKLGIMLLNSYWDDYSFSTSLNGTCEDVYLNIECQRNTETLKKTLEAAESMGLLSNSDKLINSIRNNEPVVCQISFQSIVNVCSKLIKSYLAYNKSDDKQSKAPHILFEKSLPYALVLCRKLVTVAIQLKENSLPDIKTFSKLSRNAFERIKEKLDKNDIREIKKTMDAKVRFTFRNAIFVILSASIDRDRRKEDYKLMFVILKHLVYMALMEQLDDECEETNYLDSSLLAEGIALLTLDNTHSLNTITCGIFDKAVSFVDTLLDAPKGFGYKLPLFTYTLSYAFECIRDGSTKTSRGCLELYNNVVKTGPTWYLMDKHKELLNFYSYVLHHIDYDKIKEIKIGCESGIFEIYDRIFTKNLNDPTSQFVCRNLIDISLDWCYSPIEKVQQLGFSIFRNVYDNKLFDTEQLLKICSKKFTNILQEMNISSACSSVQTQVTRYRALCGMLRFNNIWEKIGGFNCTDVSMAFNNIRLSFAIELEDLQLAFQRHATTAEFPEIDECHLSYAIVLRTAQIQFLTVILELVIIDEFKKGPKNKDTINSQTRELISFIHDSIFKFDPISREILKKELRKVKKVFQDKNIYIDEIVDRKQIINSVQDKFSKMNLLFEPHLDLYIALTSLYRSETIIKDVKPIFFDILQKITSIPGNLTMNNLQSIKKVLFIICDRDIKSPCFVPVILSLIAKLSATFYLDDKHLFEKDIFPLINDHPEQFFSFFFVKEKVFDRTYYQLCKKFIYSDQTRPLKDYLQMNPYIFEKLLDCQLLGQDGITWEPITFDNQYTRAEYDLFVFGILLNAFIKLKSWFATQKELMHKICNYFGSSQFSAEYSMRRNISSVSQKSHQFKSIELPVYRVPEYAAKIMLLYYTHNLYDFKLLIKLCGALDCGYLTNWTFVILFFREEIYPKMTVEWRRAAINYFVEQYENLIINPTDWNAVGIFMLYVVAPSVIWHISRFDPKELILGVPNSNENVIANVIQRCFTDKVDQHIIRPYTELSFIGIFIILRVALKANHELIHPANCTTKKEVSQFMYACTNACYKIIKNNTRFDETVKGQSLYFLAHMVKHYSLHSVLIKPLFRQMLQTAHDEANPVALESMKLIIANLMPKKNPNIEIVASTLEMLLASLPSDIIQTKHFTFGLRVISENYENFYLYRSTIFKHIMLSILKGNLFAKSPEVKKEFCDFMEVVGKWEDMRHTIATSDGILPDRFDYDIPRGPKVDENINHFLLNIALNQIVRFPIHAATVNSSTPIHEIITKKCYALFKVLFQPQYFGKLFKLTNEIFDPIKKSLATIRNPASTTESKNSGMTLLSTCFEVIIQVIKTIPRNKVLDLLKQLQPYIIESFKISHPHCATTSYSLLHAICTLTKFQTDGIVELPELNNYLKDRMLRISDTSNKGSQRADIKVTIGFLKILMEINDKYIETVCQKPIIDIFSSFLKQLRILKQTHEPSKVINIEKSYMEMLEVFLEICSNRFPYWGQAEKNDVLSQVFHPLSEYLLKYPKLLVLYTKIAKSFLQTQGNETLGVKMISNIRIKIEYKILKSEALRNYMECINLIFNNEAIINSEGSRQIRELIFLAAQYEDIVVSKNNSSQYIYARMQPDLISKFIHFFDHSCYHFTQNFQKVLKSFIQLFMYQGSINLEEVIEKIKNNYEESVYNHTVLPNGSFSNIPSYYNLLTKTCFAIQDDESMKMEVTDSFSNCNIFDLQEDTSTPSSETQGNNMTIDDYLTNLYNFYSCLKGNNIQKETLSIIVLSGMNIECTTSMFRDIFVSAWKSLSNVEHILLEAYIDRYLKNFNQMASSLSQIHTQIKFVLQVLLECDPLPKISPDTLRYVMEYANNHHVVLTYLERLHGCATDMPVTFNKQPILFQLESNQLYNLELLDALSDVYNVLGDKDQVFAIWSKRGYHNETSRALLSYAHGDYENCIKFTEKILENYSQGKNFPFVTHLTPEMSIEVNQQKTVWLESLKELGQWEKIQDYASNEAVQDVFTLCESCFHLKNIEAVKDLLGQMAINVPFNKIASTALFDSIISVLEAFKSISPVEEDFKSNSEIIRTTKSKVAFSHTTFISAYRRLPQELTDIHLDMLEKTTIYTDISEIVEWLGFVAQTTRNNQHVINDFRIRMNRWCNKVMSVPKVCKIKNYDLFACWRRLMLAQINNTIKDKVEQHYYDASFHKDITKYVVTIFNHTTRSFANLLRDHQQFDRAIDELLTLFSTPETDGNIGLQTSVYLACMLNKKAKYYKTSPEEREKTLNSVIIHTYDCVENTVSFNNLDILSRLLVERAKAFSLQGKYHHAEESFILALQSANNNSHLANVWLKMTRFFQTQLEITTKPSLELCESAIVAFMRSLSSKNLWKNRKNLIDLLWLLKMMSVLGGEYNIKAEEIIAKMLPTVTICTFGFVINDLVFELKERPSNAIKLILLNYARKFPQRIYYALRSHISEDDIRHLFNHFKDNTVYSDFISNAKTVHLYTNEIQCNLGENRARADINELIFCALQSKPTELLSLYHICKELSELSESPLEELIKYSYKTIDKCIKLVENSLKINNKEGWITSITNEVNEWKCYVLKKLETDETQSEKRINKLISITNNMFNDNGTPLDNFKSYLTQIIDWVSIVVSFILEGGRSTQKPFMYDYVGHYNPKVCNIEIFSFALYGHLIQSVNNQEEVFRYTISEFIPFYKVAFRNGKITKEFYVIGNSGKRFSYTIEKQDNVDIKNRISIFYKHLNYVMSKDHGTRSRNLQFSENRFIPIAIGVCLFDSTILRQIPDEFSAIRVFSFYDTLEMSFDNRRKILQPIFTFIEKMFKKLPYSIDKASKIISEIISGSSNKQAMISLNMFTKFIEIKQIDANFYYLGRKRIVRQYALTSIAEHILHMRTSTLKDICIDGTSMQLFSNNYEIDYHNKCPKYEQTFLNHIRLTPNIESYFHHSLEGHFYGTFIAFTKCFSNRSMTKYLKLIFLDHLLTHSLRELSLFENVNETMQDLDNFFKEYSQIDTEKPILWEVITKAISMERVATISISDHPWY
ncbi:Transformation/transcription domain-associated protein [Strongyloides ratti]|uniref:Transformation/transcription domain-associated protein n=1 Tax=Strongyloides ratti TaxID=34506 RepID=A0A090L9Z5_STRRB|nr:Transformation/transcription domain-associated protein [Strongyloides ratti]CEF64320.1 Transformation/transcription domain-associated protein [Strongyloides ratti]